MLVLNLGKMASRTMAGIDNRQGMDRVLESLESETRPDWKPNAALLQIESTCAYSVAFMYLKYFKGKHLSPCFREATLKVWVKQEIDRSLPGYWPEGLINTHSATGNDL